MHLLFFFFGQWSFYIKAIFLCVFQIDVSDAEVNYVAKSTSFINMAANPSVNYEHWKDFGFAFKDKGRFLRKGINTNCTL